MEKAEWLPVLEFEGIEYVVDVQNRCFSQLVDPTESVAFHTDEGREMVSAMTGTERWAWTLRADDRAGVV
jgi:hypothetical protein